METYHPYDLTSALQSAIETARRTGEARYVIQTAWGYRVTKELELVLYNAWKINADGSIADDYKDAGYGVTAKV